MSARVEFGLCAKAVISFLSIFTFLMISLFLACTFVPLCIFRWLVSKAAVILRPDLYKMLDPLSMLFYGKGVENENRSNLTITIKIGGSNVDPGQLFSKITGVFINSKSENGASSYPEFKMHPELWMGYPFWKSETGFKIEDHLRVEVLPTIFCTAEEEEKSLLKFETNLLKIPFQYGKSPWEVVLLTGTFGYSYVFIKIQHCLCDGETMCNLLMKVSDNGSPVSTISDGQTTLSKTWEFLKFPFRASYKITEDFFRGSKQPDLPWVLPMDEMTPDNRILVKSTRTINCDNVKIVSAKHGVCFTSVLLSSISGGIHNFLKQKDIAIPEFWTTYLPIPRQNHPECLSNQFAAVIVGLPVGECNSVSRLKITDLELRADLASATPMMCVLHNFLKSARPHCLKGEPSFGIPLGLSNFIASKSQVTVLGFPVLDIHFNLFAVRWTDVFLYFCSYNNQIRIICSADPKIFPTEEQAQEFLDEIIKEFDVYQNL